MANVSNHNLSFKSVHDYIAGFGVTNQKIEIEFCAKYPIQSDHASFFSFSKDGSGWTNTRYFLNSIIFSPSHPYAGRLNVELGWVVGTTHNSAASGVTTNTYNDNLWHHFKITIENIGTDILVILDIDNGAEVLNRLTTNKGNYNFLSAFDVFVLGGAKRYNNSSYIRPYTGKLSNFKVKLGGALLMHYPLTDDWNDVSGNNYHLDDTSSGTTTLVDDTSPCHDVPPPITTETSNFFNFF